MHSGGLLKVRGKPQWRQQIYLDLQVQNCWHKCKWNCVVRSSLGWGIEYGMHQHCYQSCSSPGPSPPISIPSSPCLPLCCPLQSLPALAHARPCTGVGGTSQVFLPVLLIIVWPLCDLWHICNSLCLWSTCSTSTECRIVLLVCFMDGVAFL